MYIITGELRLLTRERSVSKRKAALRCTNLGSVFLRRSDRTACSMCLRCEWNTVTRLSFISELQKMMASTNEKALRIVLALAQLVE